MKGRLEEMNRTALAHNEFIRDTSVDKGHYLLTEIDARPLAFEEVSPEIMGKQIGADLRY
jgi:hypothetical protein